MKGVKHGVNILYNSFVDVQEGLIMDSCIFSKLYCYFSQTLKNFIHTFILFFILFFFLLKDNYIVPTIFKAAILGLSIKTGIR